MTGSLLAVTGGKKGAEREEGEGSEGVPRGGARWPRPGDTARGSTREVEGVRPGTGERRPSSDKCRARRPSGGSSSPSTVPRSGREPGSVDASIADPSRGSALLSSLAFKRRISACTRASKDASFARPRRRNILLLSLPRLSPSFSSSSASDARKLSSPSRCISTFPREGTSNGRFVSLVLDRDSATMTSLACGLVSSSESSSSSVKKDADTAPLLWGVCTRGGKGEDMMLALLRLRERPFPWLLLAGVGKLKLPRLVLREGKIVQSYPF